MTLRTRIAAAQRQIAVAKVPGEPISVTVNWVAGTVDAAGNPISWDYQLSAVVLDLASLQPVGVSTFVTLSNASPGRRATIMPNLTTPGPAGISIVYGMRVVLRAARSDASRRSLQPDWVRVDTSDNLSAVLVL